MMPLDLEKVKHLSAGDSGMYWGRKMRKLKAKVKSLTFLLTIALHHPSRFIEIHSCFQ